MHVGNRCLKVLLKSGRGKKKWKKVARGLVWGHCMAQKGTLEFIILKYWQLSKLKSGDVSAEYRHILGPSDWPAFISCSVGKVCIVWPCPRLTDQALANHDNTRSVACYRGLPSPGNVDVFVQRISKFVMTLTNLLSGATNVWKTCGLETHG